MRIRSSFAPLLALLAILAGQPHCSAQIAIGKGGIIVVGEGGADSAKEEADPAGPQLIEFFDGRVLHGTLEAMDFTRKEVLWQRTDASATLAIPLQQINRLTFVPSLRLANPAAGIAGLEDTSTPSTSDATLSKLHATVKFVGGDWLTADVARIQDNQVQLRLADGSTQLLDRSQVDWIYFSKGAAPECYDGPTGLSGWISGGGWTYSDGTLRAVSPTLLSRNFTSLPDQVLYDFVIDQGNLMTSFNLNLHGRVGQTWSGEPGLIQCMVRANTLNLYSNSDGRFKNEQIDLSKVLGAALDGRTVTGKRNPVRFRIYEDFTGGRLAIFINDRKAGEWKVQQGDAGKNRGGISLQPTVFSAGSEQTLSHFRVVPWDGRVPSDGEKDGDETNDWISLADGTSKAGKFVDFAAGTLRLRAGGQTFEAGRDQLRMLHFARHEGAVTEFPPSVARVRLLQGGEFEASAAGFHDGKLQIRARFGSNLSLPLSALMELSFVQSSPRLSTADDILVFQNGDRLKGKMDLAEEDQKVRWRTDEGTAPVDFSMGHIAGVHNGWGDDPEKGDIDSVVRFRNGDWLAGRFLTLDKESLVLETPSAGQLSIRRSLVRTLYFSRDGALPISDGAADDREWLRGLDLSNNPGASNPRRPIPRSANLWRSFDGTFSLNIGELGDTVAARTGGVQIGRLLESLPSLVEVSFDVSGQRGQILFSAQLFTESGSPGYFMQMHSQGLYVYDLNPGNRARGGMVPQQVQFDGKLQPDARTRHVQLLANRDTGRLVILVDGVIVTQFGAKPGAAPRTLGKGLMLAPQANLPCTFSNIWVGPWNGQVQPSTPGTDTTYDTAILNNGDEAPGTVEIATPNSIKLNSDVGPLELPLERVTMIDFGGAPVVRTYGARLHLAGAGSLTVGSYHVEHDQITCQSDMIGELHLPLHAVRELVFSPSKLVPAVPGTAQE